MVTVEFVFRDANGGAEEIRHVDLPLFAEEAVQELLNSHWDDVIVHRWRIIDDVAGRNGLVRVEVEGEYIDGAGEYFELPFAEAFRTKLLEIDPHCDVEGALEKVSPNVGEVYVLSGKDRRFCVLDTNDLIVSQDCVFASKRGMSQMEGVFGSHVTRSGTGPTGPLEGPCGHCENCMYSERIKDPVQVAELIKELKGIKESSDYTQYERLGDLEWDLKMALFRDYHDEMLDAFIGTEGGTHISSASAGAGGARTLAQKIGLRYRQFHAIMVERGLLRALASAFWSTLTNTIVIAVFVTIFDLSPAWIVLSTLNRETIQAHKMLVTELGYAPLVAIARAHEDLFDACMGIYTFAIKLVVTLAIGNRGPAAALAQRQMSLAELVLFYPIRFAQDLVLATTTLFPPFAAEYNRQMALIEPPPAGEALAGQPLPQL